ncbi:dopamine N-acetyltransferase-like [Copidosoma floridanum]|uniref:dopamine N-acetyltransferase-like n=1 Tax=Copidosoma floridanum TaxID=29053 RepID=UPI000C6F5D52|nr:dopamine N-acetyltransferase-like [Copidosoma floridanum]
MLRPKMCSSMPQGNRAAPDEKGLFRDQQIVGAALNGVIKKGEREECERRLAELRDEKFKSIFGLLYKINERVDLFDKYGVDELFECRILSVDENYRGRGLANTLVENSITLARNSGFKVHLLLGCTL